MGFTDISKFDIWELVILGFRKWTEKPYDKECPVFLQLIV